LRAFLLSAAVCAALVALVPLMVWAATGSLRHGLYALKQYTLVLAGFVVAGGLVGVWAGFMGWVG
jgi:type IV secretory pathway protease TraF